MKNKFYNIKIYKLITLFCLITIFANKSIFTQERKEPNIQLTLALVSDYVWRGEDFFFNKFVFDKKDSQHLNFNPAFQPNLFVLFPTGLYFNLWGNYALQNRADKDLNMDGIINTKFTNTQDPCNTNYTGNDICEQNGLARRDEVDYTLGYKQISKFGKFDFGAIAYTYPKSSDIRVKSSFELMFTYTPPIPINPDLSFSLYSDLILQTEFFQILYAHTFNVHKYVGVYLSFLLSYQNDGLRNISNWKYGSASFGFTFENFQITLTGIHRFTPEFFNNRKYNLNTIDNNDTTLWSNIYPSNYDKKIYTVPHDLWVIYMGYLISI